MKNALNEIALRRLNKILLTEARGDVTGTLSSAEIATFNLNLQGLGYTLSPRTITAIKKLDRHTMLDRFEDTLKSLKSIRGVSNYRPMYPNFPEQVLDATQAELYLNAILHYFSFAVSDALQDPDIIWLPKYRKEARAALDDKKYELTVLSHINDSARRPFLELGTKISASNTSISETDKSDLKTLAQYNLLVLPSLIPNKENLATIGAILTAANSPDIVHVAEMFTTATDVLRLAVALSGGDVSLAEPTKFRSFKRAERRMLLTMLENCNALAEDMLRWDSRWIRLGERLHPGEYADTFSKIAKAFHKIRENIHIETFNSKTEAFIKARNILGAVEHLRSRPGELARRLDQLLRLSPVGAKHVVDVFLRVASEVSTPVLLQVYAHFKSRNTQNIRVVFPKGNTAKVQALVGRRVSIDADTCERVLLAVEHTLDTRFAALPALGKVYVDPKLANYLVPFSQRSASKALRTLVRGSKIAFPVGKDTLRFFIHWKNTGDENDGGWSDTGRVDLDLSALMYDSEWNFVEQISYTNLRNTTYEAVHSGDITNAPKGACEFIDINMPSLMKYGGIYVVMMVNSFTHQKFNKIPQCFAGWMLRDANGQRGEIFEAKTVVDKIDLTSESEMVMPIIIDLASREVVWADAAISRNRRYVNNVDSNQDTIKLIGQAFTKIQKPDLYTLFSLHAKARGRLVTDPKKADVVFSVETGTPFELETIASEFMQNPVKKKVAKA